MWSWPLPNYVPWVIPTGDHYGAFGDTNHKFIEPGVTLWGTKGHPVCAVETGTVLRVIPGDTIMVAGKSGVVVYNHIEALPNLPPTIQRGETLGTVGSEHVRIDWYRPGYTGEPIAWEAPRVQPPMLLDPTHMLVQAWSRVTDRFHRLAPAPPTNPIERRQMVSALLKHPLWTYPFEDETEGKRITFDEGTLNEAACFDFVYVDPTVEYITGDRSRDTAFRVWIEAGGWWDQSTDPNIPAPPQGWTSLNKWNGQHDIRLDCGSATMEAALLELALRVNWYYIGREDRPDAPQRCEGSFTDDDKYVPGCRDAGDGFCVKCGYLVCARWTPDDA